MGVAASPQTLIDLATATGTCRAGSCLPRNVSVWPILSTLCSCLSLYNKAVAYYANTRRGIQAYITKISGLDKAIDNIGLSLKLNQVFHISC